MLYHLCRYCLPVLFLCGCFRTLNAQKYKGVGIINSKGRIHKERYKWKHELQVGVKFPNAQAVAMYPWLTPENTDEYQQWASAFSLAYYMSLSEKVAIGLEAYYDENSYSVYEGYYLLYNAYRSFWTILLPFRYTWYAGAEGNGPCRWYSSLAIGYGFNLVREPYYYDKTVKDRSIYPDWRYKPGVQAQAVLLGLLYGSKKIRAVGELGYGSMYLVKAGLNYQF